MNETSTLSAPDARAPQPAPTAGTGLAALRPAVIRPDDAFKRYLALELRDPFLQATEIRTSAEYAAVYTKVFNDVDGVDDKWNITTAAHLIKDRLSRPGLVLALLDTQQDNRIVGGFMARIAPGREGMSLTDPDVFVIDDSRNQKLGSALGALGRDYANRISLAQFRESIRMNDSSTYRQPDFPKEMWRDKGYYLEDLWTQTASQLLHRTDAPRIPSRVIIRDIEEHEIDNLAAFMSDTTTRTSDGMPWEQDRAKTFLQYMYRYNRAILRVAENGTGIVGLMVGDTIPRRTGTALVNLSGFVTTKRSEAAQVQIAGALLQEIAKAANTVSLSRYGDMKLAQLEIPERSRAFFAWIMPSLKMDLNFMAMHGQHSEITKNIRPKNGQVVGATSWLPQPAGAT